MSKFFKNVTSYNNLKEQYKKLIKANHPDNGGSTEQMQDINAEFEALFKIWKDRRNAEQAATTATKEEKEETAESVKRRFYTEFGWAGDRYEAGKSLKDIAKTVRAYIKEKYPLCKFSVRTHYASMCQSLSIDFLEFNGQMYKTAEDLKSEGVFETHSYRDEKSGEVHTWEAFKPEIDDMLRRLRRNNIWNPETSYSVDDVLREYTKACEISKFYAIRTEAFKAVFEDVTSFAESYNYSDCDGMIDYFDVNFYTDYDYKQCKEVKKTERIQKHSNTPKRTNKATKPAQEAPEAEAIEKKSKLSYTITKGEDTRDLSELWVVRINETLDKAAYIEENKAMKQRGGYYSKFKHGFIFRFDPTEILTA